MIFAATENGKKVMTMAEYIEREAAIEAVKHAWAKGLEPSQYIEIIPAAEPQPDGIQFRTVDDLGRICIPKDIRDKLGIKPGTECAVYATDELMPEEIIVIRRNKKNDKH